MNLAKKITTSLIFLIFCFSIIRPAQLTPIPPSPKNQDPLTTIPRKISKNFAKKTPQILLALIYLCCLAPDEVKQTIREQLTPQNLLKNFAKEYLCSLLTTIGHELSHGLSAKCLANSPIEINLCGNTKDPTLFNSEHLKIKGIDPRKGSCILTLNKNFSKKQNLKYAAIYMSGGLGGALVAILLNLIINLIEKNPNNAQTVLFQPLVFEQLANALIPITKVSDAAKVWKNCLNASDETIQTATEFQYLLYELSELYLAHIQAGPIATDVDKIFVTILNSNTKGFLRFHV